MKFMSSSDESPLEVEETFQEVQGVSRMRGKRKRMSQTQLANSTQKHVWSERKEGNEKFGGIFKKHLIVEMYPSCFLYSFSP